MTWMLTLPDKDFEAAMIKDQRTIINMLDTNEHRKSQQRNRSYKEK